MKHKAILVSFIAFFAVVLALNLVAASTGDFVDNLEVEINGELASTDGTVVIAGEVSDKIPVEVAFTANRDVDDVRVEVSIEGYRDEIEEETPRFKIYNGSRYVKRFVLELPTSMDLDDLVEDLTLDVEISAKGEGSVEGEYDMTVQRETYSLDILSVEVADHVGAGGTLAVDVVVQNYGQERLDNVYIRAVIPELGVSRRIYAGDLSPYEEGDYDDIRDSVNKRVYLTLPRDAMSGTYEMEVEVYNYDAFTSVVREIVVEELETGVLATKTSRTIAPGEETTFDVVLVNPNERMVLYTVTPEDAEGLIIDVMDPVVTIPGGSSRTVKVNVRATESATEGTNTVTANVNADSETVRQVSFTVNVEEDREAEENGEVVAENNVVLILTIVLVIIFVVLLVVLIVLLTKKPAEPEEFGETSYY
ncbi:hypothetical protein GF386_03005 [Candidatus Pacearchaeota archaeon]|nr:hypothetical protein [Candidatus Pacearchaeota archaeon]MBD3283108.1 hypothetical protein [Candidatus Pacearchaeota archaeon]